MAAKNHKDETYNKYGDSERKVEIDPMVGHGSYARFDISAIPRDCAVIGGRFVSAMANEPLKFRYAKNWELC